MISDTISRSVSRRRFLQRAGAGFAVGSLLAACQPSSSGAPSGPPPSGPPPTQAPAAAPTQAQAQPAQQAPAQPTGAAQNLKIGATISLTGRYAALGEQVKNLPLTTGQAGIEMIYGQRPPRGSAAAEPLDNTTH